MRSEGYQIALISLGFVAAAFFAVFFYRELYPEYRIYQSDYIALEKFRAGYTGEPPPIYHEGVKQIVFEREDKGPPMIDRCSSCHVALQLPHFSPVHISHDENGNVLLDSDGMPIKETNKEYIWAKLNQKIAELTDVKTNQLLSAEGNPSKVKARLKEAEELRSLKTAKVGEHVYDVAKVLAMHPLIGKETRPFELHPIDEYGCTSCHSGNGKGLTTDKAHGPAFDGKYEPEYMGPKPDFLERDAVNDPKFASIFNDKPSDALLFQTTPILSGNLMQAKCVQCHNPVQPSIQASLDPKKLNYSKSGQADLNTLTGSYRRGQELYITQACYACHRIAGFSRGGVGPELTFAGKAYPWYIKEKITWPQGTLKTSTMPNMHLDHVEVENLMAFLLGQNGPTKTVSPIDYKVGIQEWEAGKKQLWELPVLPTQIHDLRYSMTVFATQGCAACHRLKGFESNVGFRIEKTDKESPSFDALHNEHMWFQRLFPETVAGSEIVKKIEEHAEEIDNHIVDGVRENSLLEELEQNYPDIIESLYSPFRFALRAKNHLYKQTSETNGAPEKKHASNIQLKQWQEQVRRVMMMYVQEYGLGRLIGPRPNWSGVYRSDEWLMKHFRNPSGSVPNSIMPIFPFDDSKFQALTFMLDVLGKRNRDDTRAIWKNFGFDPGEAFQIHCAQCHGEFLQGDGPVSTWLYPLPKDLRNADFLRNLTKEEAIQSIAHGIKGTPMPPWGEAPKDKYTYDGIPVLSKEQIALMVDWLYSSLPGATIIKKSQDVPKWQYSPKDIIEELKSEGHQIEPFEEINNPRTGEDKHPYFIKENLYTKYNLEQGRLFFENNCAICHGKEADGAGARASVMVEAKPRMLTNLDWLKSRDDLRLLRSIKYGVQGTAMTPWGDLTNALQRLQLVMYIRSLSRENILRDQLTEALYYVFANKLNEVENSRTKKYSLLEEAQRQLNEIKKEQETALKEANPSSNTIERAWEKYKQQFKLSATLEQHSITDQRLLDLKKIIAKQENIYRELGIDLLRSGITPADWNTFIAILRSNAQPGYPADERKKMLQQIIFSYDNQLDQLQHEKQAILGKIASVTRKESLKELDAKINTLIKVKHKMDESFAKMYLLQQNEQALIQETK